jgi:hypothetical protein
VATQISSGNKRRGVKFEPHVGCCGEGVSGTRLRNRQPVRGHAGVDQRFAELRVAELLH